MTSGLTQRTPYLVSSRRFPLPEGQLKQELEIMYIDIATAVNLREISIYETSEGVTGELWFRKETPDINNPRPKRQTIRKVFQFDDSSLVFAHNIAKLDICTHIYGAAKNTTNFFPIPYVSTLITDQIAIDVTSTTITITKGGTAPAITEGIIVLEFLIEE